MVDLEKAIDRVDWEFLKKVLLCKNFDRRWISWIMGCIKDPRFSVFINGRPCWRIFASRGIRQGHLFLHENGYLKALLWVRRGSSAMPSFCWTRWERKRRPSSLGWYLGWRSIQKAWEENTTSLHHGTSQDLNDILLEWSWRGCNCKPFYL